MPAESAHARTHTNTNTQIYSHLPHKQTRCHISKRDKFDIQHAKVAKRVDVFSLNATMRHQLL